MGEQRWTGAKAACAMAACAMAAGLWAVAPVPSERPVAAQEACEPTVLDDGVVRVGVDPDAGGAISWLGPSGTGENLVNTWDLGRYVQQSYYSGPFPYLPPGATAHPWWPDWPWNPIQAGDAFGNGAQMTALANDGDTLYVETVPLQWALDGVAGEATMQTWISLDPATPGAVRVHNVLRNRRTDGTAQHDARDQELPAVYTNWPYVRVFTYTGDAPFTGGAATEIDTVVDPGVTFPWKRWRSTEGWSALLDDGMTGLGVVHPGAVSTIGGRAGTDHPHPINTGYLSPLHQEIIDHDSTYAYDYSLVLGDLDDIRTYAERHRVDPRPEHVFSHDRQHVTYRGAVDTGLPTPGHLDVVATTADPQVVGPAAMWSADAVPQLFVRAAFETADTSVELYFADGEGRFDATRRVTFDVVGDGVMRTYQVDLAGHPEYAGSIGGLRLDPGSAVGDRVRLAWISYRDDPPEPEAPSSPAIPAHVRCDGSVTTTSTGSAATAPVVTPAVVPTTAPPRFTG